MPLFKNRHDHVKVYRPNGTRYAEARSVGGDPTEAVKKVCVNFLNEFGYVPKQGETVIEVIGAAGGWIAQVFEIKD